MDGYTEELAKAVALLREARLDATHGLPEELFWMISSLTIHLKNVEISDLYVSRVTFVTPVDFTDARKNLISYAVISLQFLLPVLSKSLLIIDNATLTVFCDFPSTVIHPL